MQTEPIDGEVKITLASGVSHIIPQGNLANTMRLLQNETDGRRAEDHKSVKIVGTKYYKKPELAPIPTEAVPVIAAVKDKASLLGDIYDKEKNKVDANKLIDWIYKCESLEDLGIVMKGETRKTVKTAYTERINDLL